MNKKTIGEIYNCNYIEDNGNLYPLQKWYNELIDKSTSEITVSDVLKMVRQKEFIELAVLKSIDLLKCDPLVGELYDGELLEKLYTIDKTDLQEHYYEIQIILSKARVQSDKHEWLCEEEREEFSNLINEFANKINIK